MRAPFDVHAFLDEPLRPAQVAAVSPSSLPLLGSMWFLFEQGRFWLSSRIGSPILVALGAGSEVALIVDDFSPPTSIRQVRVRGPAAIAAHDPDRVVQIYRRYLGDSREAWPPQFTDRPEDRTFALWTVTPRRGLAVTFPGFEPHEVRWDSKGESPLS